MKSPIDLLSNLWTDVQRLNPAVKGLDRDLLTIEKRFENEGYGFLTVALPALDDSLLRGLSDGKFTCPTGFKTIRGGTIPRLFSGMFCEIFEPFSGLLKENPDIGILKCLREVLRLFKKTQLSSSAEDFLDKKAKIEFFQCDEEAGKVIIPDHVNHLIGIVSKVVLNDLCSKDVSQATYRHGPGAVEEGLKSNQKWSALTKSILNNDFDIESYGFDAFSLISLKNNILGMRKTSTSTDLFTLDNGASRRTARLISVPKNSTSRRTITVEPLLNQFIQQGLNIQLRDSISRCSILSNCLALTDQSKNQKLALEGSLYDNWATIDLKSASDLLSVKLVESVFRHHGQFFDHMMDCRSTSVKCGKENPILLRKFAGMGNALTFPVQSICFAIVCIASILHARGRKPTYWDIKRASRLVRVYGDDIIVRTQHAQQCVDWLHLTGLKVNEKKSFLKGNFKESCGVHAFRGYDVTPLYMQHRPDQLTTEPSVIAHLVSFSNLAWLRGLYSLSTSIRVEVEGLLRRVLPLVSVQSGSLGWHSRTDAVTPQKWCRNTQQFLTRTLALTSLKRRDRLDGYAALLKFFLTPLLGRGKNHLSESPIRFKQRLVSRWVPSLVRETDQS